MIPDIIIANKDKHLIVIDAKYSTMSDFSNRAITHQIMSYMLLLDCNYRGLIFPDQKESKKAPIKEMKDIKKFAFNIPIVSEEGNDEINSIKELIISAILKELEVLGNGGE